MKGNEQDCICAKENDIHEKHCDAYRLGQFYIKLASVLSELSDTHPTSEVE